MLQKNEAIVCPLSATDNKNNGTEWSPEPLFDRPPPRLLGIFRAWRLRAYSLGIATVYAVVFVHFYRGGGWIINIKGAPIYTDFTTAWVAGLQALQGNVATPYDPAEFLKMQPALLGALDFVYPNWPYPPMFSLLLAPFAILPYSWAFIAWDLLTLAGCVGVAYLIARRSPAIALVLASPFTAWNFLAGQKRNVTADQNASPVRRRSLDSRSVASSIAAHVGTHITLTQQYIDMIRGAVTNQVHGKAVGTAAEWSNPASGNSGSVKLVKKLPQKNQQCEEIGYTVRSGGTPVYTEHYHFVSCLQPDGTWKIV